MGAQRCLRARPLRRRAFTVISSKYVDLIRLFGPAVEIVWWHNSSFWRRSKNCPATRPCQIIAQRICSTGPCAEHACMRECISSHLPHIAEIHRGTRRRKTLQSPGLRDRACAREPCRCPRTGTCQRRRRRRRSCIAQGAPRCRFWQLRPAPWTCKRAQRWPRSRQCA